MLILRLCVWFLGLLCMGLKRSRQQLKLCLFTVQIPGRSHTPSTRKLTPHMQTSSGWHTTPTGQCTWPVLICTHVLSWHHQAGSSAVTAVSWPHYEVRRRLPTTVLHQALTSKPGTTAAPGSRKQDHLPWQVAGRCRHTWTKLCNVALENSCLSIWTVPFNCPRNMNAL